MRVLYLNPFSQEVSGPDESLRTLIEALVPLGIEPHVALPRAGPQVARYEALGARVHLAPLSVLKRHPGFGGGALLGPRLARGALAVARLARRERVDLIHTNMEVVLDGGAAATAMRIPHVLHYRGNTLDEPRLVFDALTAWWTRTADRVLCISNATAEIFRKRGLGARVEAFYNPVDLDRFAAARRSQAVRDELGAGPEDVLAVAVGRVHPRKDLATFLRAGALAAARFERLKLAVVGTAEAAEELQYLEVLRGLAKELKLGQRLRWAGASRHIPEVMKAADMLVLSSRNEGFGRVVAEAMAAGTPLVVTGESAPRELVEPGVQGFHALGGNAQDFAEKMVRLSADTALRMQLGAAGPARAALFSSRVAAKRMAALYVELVGR